MVSVPSEEIFCKQIIVGFTRLVKKEASVEPVEKYTQEVKAVEEKFLYEIRKKIVMTYLPVIIMARLAEIGIIRATDIILILNEHYGIQMSPGTIYPIFQRIEKKGHIKRLPNRTKKTWVLTSKGKETIKFIQGNSTQIGTTVEELLKGGLLYK